VKQRIDFMVAGNQKCGTTTLARRLGQHPDARMSKPKELRWFSRDDVDQSELGYRAYHDHGWGQSDLDEAFVYGEATPKYVLHTKSGRPLMLERIAKYNPNIKLIVLFRDPVDRAFSQWNMLERNGRKPPPFPELVSSGLSNRSAPYNKVLRRGEYGRIASNILSLFPAENCCFIRTTKLDDQMDQICEFLGLLPVSLGSERSAVGVYRSALPRELRDRLRSHYQAEVELLGRLTGLYVDDWLVGPSS
jgi:hypothetical protein